MKDHLLHLLLISLSALQLCSCSGTDDSEQGKPQRAKELRADANEGAGQGQSPATESPANPYDEIPDNQPVVHRIRAGQPGHDGWCLAKPTRGSFSVMLPGEFIDSMIKSKTTTGGTGVMHTVSTKTADGVEFTVLQTEIIGKRPGGSPVEDLMMNRFKSLDATVTKTQVVLANQPAVRLRVKAAGVAAEFILLRSSHSDYMLAVQSRLPNRGNAELEADMERFFASFKILGSEE